MQRELVEAWVQALRSGEYQQGNGQLRTRDGHYCCLGVAADLLVRRGIGSWEDAFNDGYSGWFDYADDPRSGSLPDRVQEMFGMSGRHHNKYWELNDGGVLFADIATEIEYDLLGDEAA